MKKPFMPPEPSRWDAPRREPGWDGGPVQMVIDLLVVFATFAVIAGAVLLLDLLAGFLRG